MFELPNTEEIRRLKELRNAAVGSVLGAADSCRQAVVEADVPGIVRRHPYASAAVAVGVGYFAARAVTGRSLLRFASRALKGPVLALLETQLATVLATGMYGRPSPDASSPAKGESPASEASPGPA